MVNINTASSEELELLPRVGPALAGRIIEFREANGPFQTVDEILAVKGIGESSFEKLEPFIVTSGATTLADKVRLARSTGGENVCRLMFNARSSLYFEFHGSGGTTTAWTGCGPSGPRFLSAYLTKLPAAADSRRDMQIGR